MHQTAEALLDATERVLIDDGVAGLTTRRIAEVGGQAHGSIRYHFGSLENLVVAVVERWTESLTGRQRAMYESDLPFRDKWDQARVWFEEDLAAGYPKLAAELSAASWNWPACRDGVQRSISAWNDVLVVAVESAAAEYGVDLDNDDAVGIATLIRAAQWGMLLDRLSGTGHGHAEFYDWVDGLLDALEGRGKR